MGRRQRQKKYRQKPTDESQLQMISFLKWLKLKNNQFKVVLFSDTGRGVIATRSIAKHDELCALPLKFLITVDSIKQCCMPELFNGCMEDTQTSLALYLIYQRHLGNASLYDSYLKMLPTTYSTLWFCTKLEKKLLPNWIKCLLDDSVSTIEHHYQTIAASVKDLKCSHCEYPVERFLTFEEFLWCWTTVNTRAVYFEDINAKSGKKSRSMALAPFLDLFNHSPTASVEAIVDHKRGAYILKTNKPFKRRQQVFINYGAHSNLKLLMEYGFVSDCIDQDAVEFTMEEVLKAACRVHQNFGEVTKLKYKFIKMHNLNRDLNINKDEFSWNCNGLLYVLVTRDSDLNHLLSKTYSTSLENNEKELVEQIKQVMLEQKRCQLLKELEDMESIVTCTAGFGEAKKLVRQYITIVGT